MKRFITLNLFITFVLLSSVCSDNGTDPNDSEERDYKQEMRNFVQAISSYAKGIKSNFIIIPQNGHELLTVNGDETGNPATAYINAIDGAGREDLYYGYDTDNVATPISDRNYMVAFMDIAENNGVQVLVTDYCSTTSFMDDSYTQNATKGYISFSADHRELDNIPAYPVVPYNINDSNIVDLSGAKNFLYLLNPASYTTKLTFLDALKNTNYDIILIDLFYEGTEILTSAEVISLKQKVNGGTRLVIAYMSIGEAEDYRYYWQSSWKSNKPDWLAPENPDWPGNYKVHYWNDDWQKIIYGNNESYIKKILDAGFDGVYLDIIDAFEFFE